MSLISRMLRQVAVYWPLAQVNRDGQPTWGSPVQVRCRWEEQDDARKTNEVETQVPTITVYVSALDGSVSPLGGELVPGGMLLLSSLTSSMMGNTQARNFKAREIMDYKRFPNFRVTEYERVCYVRR